MPARTFGVAVVSLVAAAWVSAAPQREKALLTSSEHPSFGSLAPLSSGDIRQVRQLESSVALHRDDPGVTRALAQAYVDARAPGLAVALIERAPASVRDDVRVRHGLARALLDQGRSERALRVERAVLASCLPLADGSGAATGCDPTLLASASRRIGILGELVALGVEDAEAHPEAARLAYINATRDARVTLQ
jgi:hypothetical protein